MSINVVYCKEERSKAAPDSHFSGGYQKSKCNDRIQEVLFLVRGIPPRDGRVTTAQAWSTPRRNRGECVREDCTWGIDAKRKQEIAEDVRHASSVVVVMMVVVVHRLKGQTSEPRSESAALRRLDARQPRRR